MESEKERLTKMLERLTKDRVEASSDRLPVIVKEHGFEHVRSEENGAFIVRDLESKKYFKIRNNRDFEEIESP